MLRDGAWESQNDNAGSSAEATAWWQTVHAALVGIAKRRAGLDAEEARWIREAEQILIWKQYGMVSMIDYLERVCGYEPRSAQHRMRVARALGELPELGAALARGELCFSAVRELVRVATPETEGAWRDAAWGKNLRQIEELVAGHKPGDRPEDPVEDSARLHALSFHELSASTFALFRQARQVLDLEHGGRLTDSDLIAAFANSILDGTQAKPNDDARTAPGDAAHDRDGDPHAHGQELAQAPAIDGVRGRSKRQVGYVVCRVCDRAWQDGGGQRIPITAAELERVRCDAQHIGALDAKTPAKATQDIPPAVVRLLWARDQGCCQTQGCRSSIVARAKGGTHDPCNLTLRCSSCHVAHHEGRIVIFGTAPDELTTRRVNALDEPAHHGSSEHPLVVPAPPSTACASSSPESQTASVPPAGPSAGTMRPLSSKYAVVARRTEVVSALRSMGWSPAIARSAVDAAIAQVHPDEPLEVLLRAALQRCPIARG